MRFNRVFLLLPLILALLHLPSTMAQTASTGALTGTVKDSSGAVVPKATVTLTSADTGQARTTMTGSDGVYRFSLLPPGNYRLRLEAAGFKPLEVPSVTVAVPETAVLDRSLDVGAQTQAVTVKGEIENVQTTTTGAQNIGYGLRQFT